MPIAYKTIAKALALRTNQLEDANDAAGVNASYTALTLDGVDLPAAAIRDVVLQTEAEIANMIGNSNNIVLRRALTDKIGVGSGQDVPAFTSGTKRFVGKFDGLFEAETGEPIPEMPAHIITLRQRSTFFKGAAMGCAFQGPKVVFFTPSGGAYIRGCVYDAVAAATAYDADGNSVLPEACALLWINKALANVEQLNFFEGKSGNFAAQAAQCAQDLGLVPDPEGVQAATVTNQENRNASNQGNQ